MNCDIALCPITGNLQSVIISKLTIVSSRYLKVKGYLKLLISHSKFSGSRKFILRYQYFTFNTGVEM